MAIFNMEMLEKVKATQKYLRSENGELKRLNVLITRIVFSAIVVAISYFLTDLRIVYAVTGVLLNSFVGLIISAVLGRTRPAAYRAKDTTYTEIMDWLCITLGFSSLGLYFYDKIV